MNVDDMWDDEEDRAMVDLMGGKRRSVIYTKRKVILCDIDGTVADCSHRRHWVDPEIAVGDRVTPINIPNAKQHYADVISLQEAYNLVHVRWRNPNTPYGPMNYGVTRGKEDWRKVKRWDKFFEEVSKDPPIVPVITTIKALHDQGLPIIFASGRPEKTRRDTIDWLTNNGLSYLFHTPNAVPVKGMKGLYHDQYETKLFMRPDNDTREDFIVKQEIYERDIKPFYDVFCVFDDRDQVVRLWRSLGLTCFQVAEGNF